MCVLPILTVIWFNQLPECIISSTNSLESFITAYKIYVLEQEKESIGLVARYCYLLQFLYIILSRN